MPVRQALRATIEQTAGVYPVSGPVAAILRMTDPVTSHPEPLRWEIRDAGGSGQRVQTGTAQNSNKVAITTPLYASTSKVWLPPFFTPNGGLPGLTTLTIDQFVALDVSALTKEYTRWLGCTPESITVRGNNSGQGVVVMLMMNYEARSYSHAITASDFATPAINAYPADNPLLFTQMAGELSIAGVTTAFKSFEITLKNTLDLVYDENPNPVPQYYGARVVDWKVDFRYKTQALQTAFEALAAEGASLALYDGTNTITWNLNAANYFTSLENQFPLDKAFYQTVGGATYLDSVAGSDMTLTITP